MHQVTLFYKFVLPVIYTFILFFSSGCYLQAVADPTIPIKGAVYHVHQSDGSHKTYFDVVVGHSFIGNLPEDIDSISVTGPNGILPIEKDDFNYNPKSRDFWLIRPGLPQLGKYTFKIVSGNFIGSASDTQSFVFTIPIPDISKLKPTLAETISCRTPAFSWASIIGSNPLFYQLQIRDINRKYVYKTGYNKDMLTVKIPPGLLNPGMAYQWRIRVADGRDWITLNNRSQSRWVTFTMDEMVKPCNYQYSVPLEVDDGWKVASLEDAGINSDKINALMNTILDGNIDNIHSVLVVRNGKIVLEDYFYGYAPHQIHSVMSVSKSISSILIGIGNDQTKIPSVDKKIYELFHTNRDITWDELKKMIRLKHVLNMTAGLDWNDIDYPDTDSRSTTGAMVRSDDWIDFVLSRKAINTPGKTFVYSNGLTILLGEILRNATGMHADKFAEEYLFKPLGISEFNWQKLQDGTVITAWGLSLKPRDMAKIGYIMLKGGKWKGQQVVSSTWVKESTQAHLEGDIVLGSGYGYQWWRGHTFINDKRIETFYAAGKGGQYIFICPELDLIAVFTSKDLGNPNGEILPQNIMVKYIIPATQPPSSPMGTVNLDESLIETYVGDYEYKKLKIMLTIFREGDKLLFRNNRETGELIPETKTQFIGTSKVIGDFKAYFSNDEKGEVYFLTIHYGFRIWQFDRVN